MITIALMAASFGLGYYVSGHPQDTRAFVTRIGDRLKALLHIGGNNGTQ